MKTSYFSLFISFVLPIALAFLNAKQTPFFTHQVWNKINSVTEKIPVSSVTTQIKITTDTIQGYGEALTGIYFQYAFIITQFIFIFYLLFKYKIDFLKVKNILKNGFLMRRYKNIFILVNHDISVPFSIRFFKKCYVAIPFSLLTETDKTKIVIAHELQHHKQKDTLYCYFVLILKCVFIFNPFFYLIEKKNF